MSNNGRTTRFTTFNNNLQGQGKFSFFNRATSHSIEESADRGKYTNVIKGDRLITEEEMADFEPITAPKKDQKLFAEQMKSPSLKQLNFTNKKTGDTTTTFMTPIAKFNALRDFKTSQGSQLSNFNDGSHGFPLSLNVNAPSRQGASNIFPEHFAANQGGASAMESRVLQDYKIPPSKPGNKMETYLFTQIQKRKGETVPNDVRRASISVERSPRDNSIENIRVNTMYAHSNDQVIPRNNSYNPSAKKRK